MLTFPEVITHEGVVVYPDDEDPNLFYCLQGVPRLRRRDGLPVFRAVFWTDQADGGESVAGLAGALVNFDVDLSIPQPVLDQIEARIASSGVQQQRQRVMERDERERLDRLARARGEAPDPSQVRVPEIGEVRFGSLRVTEGTVTLLQESEGDFVPWASTGGPPSLIGENNAAFALRLSPVGAAVWHGALRQNAAAIGVRFDLKFEARLPSLQIHIWAGSTQSFSLQREAERVVENRDQGCSDADVERVDTTEIVQSLEEEGLVHIEVIKGQAQISDEHVSQLRNLAMEMISNRVKEILKSRLKGITDEERRSSLIKVVEEEVNAFAELRFTQRDVVEWRAAPQATITDFFNNLNQSQLRELVTVVDLSDPVVSTLEVPIEVVADWDAEPKINNVIVSVEYRSANVEPRKEISLNRTTPRDTLRWRRVGRGNEQLRYEARVFLVGAAEPIELTGGRTNGAITVLVPRMGSFKAVFKAHPDTFLGKGTGKISAVQIDYRYKPVGAEDHRSGSKVIGPDQVNDGVVLQETTFRQIDAPLLVKTTFFRAQEAALEVEGERQLWLRGGESQMQLPAPWPDSLRIAARVPPTPGLREVRLEIEHRDPETGFESDGRILLDEDGEWEGSTTVVQARKEAESFRYRYSVTGAEQLSMGPWVDSAGDQALVLPVLGVHVRTTLLRLGQEFAIAIVRLRYRDETRGFETSHEFFLTPESEDPVWLVPRVDPNDDRYHVGLLLIRAEDSSEVVVPEAEASGVNLLLRPPPA